MDTVGANEMAFATNGAYQLFINANGNVGIGTTNPTADFEVAGESRSTRFAFQDDTDTYMDTVGANEMAFATNGAYQFFINANGNVGIGDTNPQNRLSVSGDIRVRNTDDFYVGSIGLNDNASTTSGASLLDYLITPTLTSQLILIYKMLLVSLILLLVPELILNKTMLLIVKQ